MLKEKKLISKNSILTAIVVFALFCFKSFFEFSKQGGIIQIEDVLLIFASGLALAVFYAVLYPFEAKGGINGKGVVGILALIFILTVVVSDTLIARNIFKFVFSVAVMLLLVSNIYSLIAAACASVVLALFFNYAAVAVIPVAMGAAMVRFAYLFKEEKKPSKKKSKKFTAEPDADNKKEKFIFIVCEAVMLAASLYTVYECRFTVTIASFISNIEYAIAGLIVCAALIALCVYSVMLKRPAIESVGYALPAVLMFVPFSMADYRMPSTASAALLAAWFVMCREGSLVGDIVEKGYNAVVEKIGKKSENKE